MIKSEVDLNSLSSAIASKSRLKEQLAVYMK